MSPSISASEPRIVREPARRLGGNVECPSSVSMSITPVKLSECIFGVSWSSLSLNEEKIAFNSGTWQRLSYSKIPQIHLQERGLKKTFGLLLSIPTGAVAALRLQRILIRRQKSLYTLSHWHIPCSLRFPPCCPEEKKQTQTKHIFSLFCFFLINRTISYCKNPNNAVNMGRTGHFNN